MINQTVTKIVTTVPKTSSEVSDSKIEQFLSFIFDEHTHIRSVYEVKSETLNAGRRKWSTYNRIGLFFDLVTTLMTLTFK